MVKPERGSIGFFKRFAYIIISYWSLSIRSYQLQASLFCCMSLPGLTKLIWSHYARRRNGTVDVLDGLSLGRSVPTCTSHLVESPRNPQSLGAVSCCFLIGVATSRGRCLWFLDQDVEMMRLCRISIDITECDRGRGNVKGKEGAIQDASGYHGLCVPNGYEEQNQTRMSHACQVIYELFQGLVQADVSS
ncbi:hypothetical protein HD554DRAFT_2080446 [Boletus coccyginus]|nr:hypothetical protein HD554DRAFT_2080446 [Boletus coccyginus]